MLRDSGRSTAGSILFTAHDLHEAPWGDGRQLDALIRAGDRRRRGPSPGTALRRAADRRPRLGDLEGPHQPRRAAGPRGDAAEATSRASSPSALSSSPGSSGSTATLAEDVHPVCGSASVFIGQIHSGEIYNQYPQECRLEGTRRWLPGTDGHATEPEFRALLADLARETGTRIECEWLFIRDALPSRPGRPVRLDVSGELRTGLEPPTSAGRKAVRRRRQQLLGAGRRAGDHPRPERRRTAHVSEWAEIADMERVALLYAVTAVSYCGSGTD